MLLVQNIRQATGGVDRPVVTAQDIAQFGRTAA
jgi:hypothetical protein